MFDFLLSLDSFTTKEFAKKIELVKAISGGVSDVSVSTFPRFLEEAAVALNDIDGVSLCSLSQFASKTYPEVTILEVAMAVENGADEIEIPLDVVALKDGDIDMAIGEIKVISEEVNGAAVVSLVVESESFSSFEEYKELVLKVVDAGVDIVTLNRKPKNAEDIKYLSDTVKLLENHPKSPKIKAYISIESEELESYSSKLFNTYGDFIIRAKV